MTNRVVIVTGAAGGIGAEAVATFEGLGDTVIGLDLRDVKCRHLAPELRHFDLYAFCKDESYKSRCVSALRASIPAGTRKLVIINNAAVQIVKALDELNESDFDRSMTVNTTAPLVLVLSLLSELEKYAGHVINIGSIHATLSKSGFAAYATSKGALHTLTRVAAIELAARGISINGIAPAAIKTQMLVDGFRENPDLLNQLSECHPTNEIGTPRDLVLLIKAIVELPTNFLTGSIIEFSGGISACLHDPK